MHTKLIIRNIVLVIILIIYSSVVAKAQGVPAEYMNPPREFSVMPFWFWNDTLKDNEIIRQIADFEAHGVYGFVIHPRIGLPDDIGWLSEKMIHAMNVAVAEAARRKMYVILYDEGMYPSGSSSGQVVAKNPDHAARALAKIDLKPGENLQLSGGKKLITIISRPDGNRVAIIDQPSGGNIRGLHYIGEGTEHLEEETPPAGDVLNPDAVTSFVELVYDRYAKEFGKYFGTTILGVFTDEPSPLGRNSARGVIPGNASLLKQINKILGYNITPHLACMWYNDLPDSEKHRTDYYNAINICLEENYYKRLGTWCRDHGVSLFGHPSGSMDIGAEKFFQVPGQDLVWRYVEPGKKALEGEHSTMAKCASGAMVHLGLRRNSNELYGAYGHDLTYDEMVWLANWCFVRGQNLLLPHAFYYSIRGPRFDERPPDVGPNASWWKDYKLFSDACSRLSWINTDSHQICDLAILCEDTWLPDKTAKICFQHQRDFNYLEISQLLKDAKVDSKGVHIAGMNYGAIILDSLSYIPTKAKRLLKYLAVNGRLIIHENSGIASMFPGAKIYKTDEDFINEIDEIISPDLYLSTASHNIRYRHVVKGSNHFYILFNEEADDVTTKIKIPVAGNRQFLDPRTSEAINLSEDEIVHFKPYELKILRVNNNFKLPPM
jgi:hypothetical protein